MPLIQWLFINSVCIMKYTDLFIDFDDTLYDTRGNAVVSLAEMFQHFGLDRYFDNPQFFYSEYWKTNVELWDLYARGEISRDYLIVERFRRPLSLGKGLIPTREMCLEISDVFLGFCSNKSGLVDDAMELIKYLKDKGYRMHICSNGFHEVQYKKLTACGLLPYFDTIILSEDAGANKPAPQYFDYAFQKSGAQKATTLMIGDNFSTDIQGALNAGISAMYFNRKPGTSAPAKVDYEIHALSEAMEVL